MTQSLTDKAQEYRTALVRVDELSKMLNHTLGVIRSDWDTKNCSFAILSPVWQIAAQMREAIPNEIKDAHD